jgi:hypothetical protein
VEGGNESVSNLDAECILDIHNIGLANKSIKHITVVHRPGQIIEYKCKTGKNRCTTGSWRFGKFSLVDDGQ